MAVLKVLSLGLSGVVAGGVAGGLGGQLLLGNNSAVVVSVQTKELEKQSTTITELQDTLNKLIQQQTDNKNNYERSLSSKQNELKELKESTIDLNTTQEQLKVLKGTHGQNSEDVLNSKIKKQKDELEKIQQERKTSLEERNEARQEHKDLISKLEQMKRLEGVFKELLKEKVNRDEITDIEQYKEKLWSVAKQQAGQISTFQKSITESMAKLIKELRSGKEVKVVESDAGRGQRYRPGYTYRLPIVGSEKEAEEFIKALTDILEKLENK